MKKTQLPDSSPDYQRRRVHTAESIRNRKKIELLKQASLSTNKSKKEEKVQLKNYVDSFTESNDQSTDKYSNWMETNIKKKLKINCILTNCFDSSEQPFKTSYRDIFKDYCYKPIYPNIVDQQKLVKDSNYTKEVKTHEEKDVKNLDDWSKTFKLKNFSHAYTHAINKLKEDLKDDFGEKDKDTGIFDTKRKSVISADNFLTTKRINIVMQQKNAINAMDNDSGIPSKNQKKKFDLHQKALKLTRNKKLNMIEDNKTMLTSLAKSRIKTFYRSMDLSHKTNTNENEIKGIEDLIIHKLQDEIEFKVCHNFEALFNMPKNFLDKEEIRNYCHKKQNRNTFAMF